MSFPLNIGRVSRRIRQWGRRRFWRRRRVKKLAMASQAQRYSRPVLTATSSSYAKAKKFDVPQSRNPWPDRYKIWHSLLRPRDDALCKKLCKSVYGGFLANGWNIRQINIYVYMYIPFSETHIQLRPLGEFPRAMPHLTRSRTYVAPFKDQHVKNSINH